MQLSRQERLRQRLERTMSAELQANFAALQGEHAQALTDIASLQRLVQDATDAAEAARLAATNATAAAAAAAAARPAASAITTTFSANPFNGDINPTNSNGLKLYQAGTAARAETSKVSATITKSKTFLDAMRDDATKFGWGMLISNIGDNNHQILHDFKDINIKMVRLSMNPIFFDRTNTTTLPSEKKPNMFDIDPATEPRDKAIFFQRVRANMIGQRIYNSLDTTSLASLKLKENLEF